ncbi:DGQHR domain-containing protein [Rhizobiales bacterium GAS113]|nr:DGQHR domain-containing protein [Rhizobiales bacterium GAS113]
MNVDEVRDPSLTELTFACLRARQPIGDIFVATIPFGKLSSMTYFDVRRVLQQERDVERYLGVQRPLDDKRVEQLQTYVNLVDASFPSSIIIAIAEDYVSFDEEKGIMTVRNFRQGEEAPSTAIRRVARVLDGQHRLAGLEKFSGQDFDLSTTIFIGADIADQAHIFATVNIEQTKVNKSLVYDLYELSRSRSPQKTCHNIVVALDRDPLSPFHKRIKRLGLATDGRVFEPVTQSLLVEGLIGYISAEPRLDRDRLLRGRPLERANGDELFKRPLRNIFVDGDDLRIIQIVYNYFVAIKERWPKAWDERGRGFMLNRTNGVKALLRFFRFAYAKVAAPGDAVPADRFLERVFRPIKLDEAAFTVENFLPGTGGEARLYRILRGKEEL